MVTMQRVNASMPQRIARDNLATALNDERAQYYQTEIARNQDQRQANLEPYLLEQANLTNQKSRMDVFNDADELNARKRLDALLASGYTPTAQNIFQQGFNTNQLALADKLITSAQTRDTNQFALDNALDYANEVKAMTGKSAGAVDADHVLALINGTSPSMGNIGSSIASKQRSTTYGSNPIGKVLNASDGSANASKGASEPTAYTRDGKPINLPGGYAPLNLQANQEAAEKLNVAQVDDGSSIGFNNLIGYGLSNGKIKITEATDPTAIAVYTDSNNRTYTASVKDTKGMNKLNAVAEADLASQSSLSNGNGKPTNQVMYVSPDSLNYIGNTSNRDLIDLKGGNIDIRKNVSSDKGFDSINPSRMPEQQFRQLTSEIIRDQEDAKIDPNENGLTLKANLKAIAKPYTVAYDTFRSNPEIDKKRFDKVLTTAEGSNRFREVVNTMGAEAVRNLPKEDLDTILKFLETGKDAGSGLGNIYKKIFRTETSADIDNMLARLDARETLAKDPVKTIQTIDNVLKYEDKNSQLYQSLTSLRKQLVDNKAQLPRYSGDMINGNPERSRPKQYIAFTLDKDGKAEANVGSNELRGKVPVGGMEFDPRFEVLVNLGAKNKALGNSLHNFILPQANIKALGDVISPDDAVKDILQMNPSDYGAEGNKVRAIQEALRHN